MGSSKTGLHDNGTGIGRNDPKFRFTKAQKYCRHCHVFIDTEDVYCPCCSLKTKASPNLKYILKKNR